MQEYGVVKKNVDKYSLPVPKQRHKGRSDKAQNMGWQVEC